MLKQTRPALYLALKHSINTLLLLIMLSLLAVFTSLTIEIVNLSADELA